MSRAGVQQRVLRAVRLLPQAIKIGTVEETETDVRDSETNIANVTDETESLSPASVSDASAPSESPVSVSDSRSSSSSGAEAGSGVPAPSEHAAREPSAVTSASKKLLLQLEAQVKALRADLETAQSDIAARDAELAAVTSERNQLASEIDDIKSDYDERKRTLEAESIENARRAADEAREKAHNEGWNAGHTDGLKTARFEVEQEYQEKFAALVKSLESVNANLNQNFASLVDLNQPRLLRLWSVMLRKMLNKNIELDPTAVKQVLQSVLTEVSDRNQILIYVAPSDLVSLQGRDGELDDKVRDMLRGVHNLELKPDTNVEPGSCVVETSLGVYDARWRTQFEQIDSVLDNIFQQIATGSDSGTGANNINEVLS